MTDRAELGVGGGPTVAVWGPGFSEQQLNAAEDASIAEDLRRIIEDYRAGIIDADSVMRSCDARLTDLDAQINHVLGTLEDASGRASAISREISELRMIERRLAPFVSGDEYRGAPALGSLTPASLRTELTRIGLSAGRIEEVVGRAGAENMFDGRAFELGEVTRLVTGTTISNPAQLTSRLESLSADLRDANSGNERAMISLQSLMQQRTSVIQMATNLLKTLDECNDSIIGNIR